MRLKAENKAQIGARIRKAAGTAFRARGYEAVSIDDAMAGAGLTRGAFYAHFSSKAVLFGKVVEHEHPLLAMLRVRKEVNGVSLWDEMLSIFDGYLDPDNFEEVRAGCSLAMLSHDAGRADDAARQAYGEAWTAIREEMARGVEIGDPHHLDAALALAAGTIGQASGLPVGQRACILGAARQVFPTLAGASLKAGAKGAGA